MKNDLTKRIASYVYHTKYDTMPKNVIDKAKECLIDTIGCILEGTKKEEFQKALNVINFSGTGEYSIIGTNEKTNLLDQTFIHSLMAHSTEYDDSHKKSKTHPGAVIIPTLLSISLSMKSFNGKRFLESIVSGYETALSIGKAIGVNEHRIKGWHATSTCGIFGAAVAASKYMNLREDQIMSALGSAGTQSSGLWAFSADGSMSKSLHAGKASQGGLLSALLAKENFSGSKYIFESEDGGFFNTFGSVSYKEAGLPLVKSFGENYTILEVAQKPYPCCRTTHAAIDAVLDLQSTNEDSLKQIRKVIVHTYDVAIRQCDIPNPINERQAAFSFQYVIAATLKNKSPLNSSDFIETALRDTEIKEISAKVEVVHSDELEKLFPETWGCEVWIETETNKIYKKRIEIAKGDPLQPMNDKEQQLKFFGCADGVIHSSQTLSVLDKLNEIETLSSLNEIIVNLTPSI